VLADDASAACAPPFLGVTGGCAGVPLPSAEVSFLEMVDLGVVSGVAATAAGAAVPEVDVFVSASFFRLAAMPAGALLAAAGVFDEAADAGAALAAFVSPAGGSRSRRDREH